MDVIFNPSIAWKVNDVTTKNFCSRKGPTFNFLGIKWKLKFVYCATAGGNKCSLVLKTCTMPEHNMQVSVSTCLVLHGCEYLMVNFCLEDLQIGKWIIWEQTTYYIEYHKSGVYTPFDSVWKEAVFRCNMSVKQVEPKNIRYEKDSDLPLIEYSPCIESLSQDFKYMFNNPSMSDITLECADKTIYAHSVILAARSPVFETMIRNGKEQQSKGHPIVVKDVEPLVMEQLVQYLYSGKIDALDSKTVYKLYVAADMYGVDALKAKCGLFMMENKDQALDTASEEKATEKSEIESGTAYFEYIKGIVKTKEWETFCKIYPKCANKALVLLVKENSV